MQILAFTSKLTFSRNLKFLTSFLSTCIILAMFVEGSQILKENSGIGKIKSCYRVLEPCTCITTSTISIKHIEETNNKSSIGTLHLPEVLCRLYTLAECIWREYRARVARDETGRVQLSTLLPKALNPREARARQGRIDESVTVPANRNFGFFVSKFWGFFEILTFFLKITTFSNVFVVYFCQTNV